MRLSIPLQAPLQTAAYPSLMDWAKSRDADVDCLRHLTWRIGAHPHLIAHGRVFENLSAITSSSPLSAENVRWASAWKDDELPHWRKLLPKFSEERQHIGKLKGLELFVVEPADARDHPFLGAHIDRSPIAAALWNRHHSVADYPPPTENSVARTYFRLQAHLFCAYAEARGRARQGLTEFEMHVGAKEFAPVPIGAGPVGRTVREFSLPAYDDLLLQLPEIESTVDFALALLDVPLDLRDIPEEARDRAQDYFENLQVYFAHFRVMLGFPKVDPRRHRGSPTTTAGGTESRPGFVHFAGGFLSFHDPEDFTEGGIPPGAFQSVRLTRHEGDGETPEAMEDSGLAPDEESEDLLDLFSPEDVSRRLSQVKYQRQALEMAAHSFWWDRGNLTPLQLRTFWNVADSAFDTWYRDNRETLANRQCACGALLLKIMLVLGQSKEPARQLRFEVVRTPVADALERMCLLAHDHMSFVISAPQPGTLDDAVPVGYLVPAIKPDYRAKLPGPTRQLGRPRQARFALPDMTNLSAQLLGWLRRNERQKNPDGTVLGIHPDTADESIRAFLKSYNATVDPGLRLSEAAFTRWLGTTCETMTGDKCLGWILTANRDRRNESRMHYTQHMASRLLDVYMLAIRRLQRTCHAAALAR